MHKANYNAALLDLTLDRSEGDSLQRQLAQALRELVHQQRLRSGDRLASSRSLAEELNVSRITVTAVYDQLIAEGYLEGRRGSGVFVAADLDTLPVAPATALQNASKPRLKSNQIVQPFDPATPDMRQFPHRDWSRIFEQVWRFPVRSLLGRPDPLGWAPLREAIAAHLGAWRGLHCNPDQVIVTSGLAEAIELLSAALFTPGDAILVEDPGHTILRRVIASCGQNCIPVRVDDSGFDILRGMDRTPDARGVIVTPSRQFPLGMTLPLSRRLALIRWANDTGGYIFEDDFDGEYRYQGQPLPAMMNLDTSERVIYIGSFSKVMFPALRLGYIVAPASLLKAISDPLAAIGPRASLVCQPVLAKFIEEGSFATHIRRMRRLYAMRQATLLKALQEGAEDLLVTKSEAGGMHIIANFTPSLQSHTTDTAAAKNAAISGVSARPLSGYFAGSADLQGFVLGYAGFDDSELRTAAQRLSESLRIGL